MLARTLWAPPVTSIKDIYKTDHKSMYPDGVRIIYSNLTPRGSRVLGVDKVMACMGQFLVKRFFGEYWNATFFDVPKDVAIRQYQRRLDGVLGKGSVKVDHIAHLHELGFLPLILKSVPEGTMVPMRVPVMTIRNTRDEFAWLTNDQETLISLATWLGMTSATTAFGYLKRQLESKYRTGGSVPFAHWQNHDFSMRGMTSEWAAMISGAAHLMVGNYGTDTLAAIDFLEHYYGADADTELVGGSVPATEHSVAQLALAGKGERDLLERLLTKVYPTGIVSYVADTRDFWAVISDVLPRLKAIIISRDGKLVIRPDSGDPVKIICGDPENNDGRAKMGLVRMLWHLFGGKRTSKGFQLLDPHIGSIYGDSITPDRHREIIARLEAMGFDPENVQGVGSYTYQYVTRDTYGFAIKATYAETEAGPTPLFKDPKTDSGVKKSARGLLRLDENPETLEVTLTENVDWRAEDGGLLRTIFLDGVDYNPTTLSEIRTRVARYLPKE